VDRENTVTVVERGHAIHVGGIEQMTPERRRTGVRDRP
jgi:hypothetical protein